MEKPSPPQAGLRALKGSKAELADSGLATEKPQLAAVDTESFKTFRDPRIKSDRRIRQAALTEGQRDRRKRIRRHYCSLCGNWWMLRKYATAAKP